MGDYNRNSKENIFLPEEAKIVDIQQVTETEKHFTLKMANGSPMEYNPGQIIEVSLFGYGEIPIGFASSPTKGDTFDIVIRTVGRVSTAINNLNKGDSLFVRGPLGNGFDIEALKGNNILVVAGGIGLCPTRSIIQYIMDKRSDFKDFTLFYGAKESKQQMFLEDLETFRCSTDINFHETVDKADDTWKGNVGVITNLFGKTKISPDTKVIICGPPIMFKFVIMELRKIGIVDDNVYLDLERRMKCGVGKCGHCQINDKYVCIDGPVFTLTDIMKLEEAI